MAQEQVRKSKQSSKTEEVAAEVATDVKSPGIDDDVDSILEDIDGVLEENAQEFVEAYIQKGGE
jgi:ubiquitin-like protein Pup